METANSAMSVDEKWHSKIECVVLSEGRVAP